MLIQVEVQKRLASQGRVFALEVDFASESERVVLFGPSGSGKTLTVKAIAGLLRPDTGRIIIGGSVLFDLGKRIDIPARHRNIGYVPQDYALFPHLTISRECRLRLAKELAIGAWLEAIGCGWTRFWKSLNSTSLKA